MVWWPWRRNGEQPAVADAEPARSEPGWAEVGAQPRVLAEPLAPVAPLDAFRADLATSHDPSFLEPLTHQVDPSAGGLVEGLTSHALGLPQPWSSGHELSVPARPAVSRTVQRRAVGWPDAAVLPSAARSGAPAATLVPAEGVGVVEPSPQVPPDDQGQVEVPVEAASPEDLTVDADLPERVLPVVAEVPARQGDLPAVPVCRLPVVPSATVQRSSAVPVVAAPVPAVPAPAPAGTTRTDLAVFPTLQSSDLPQESTSPDPLTPAPPDAPPAVTELPAAVTEVPVVALHSGFAEGPLSGFAAAPLSGFAAAITALGAHDEPAPGVVGEPEQRPGPTLATEAKPVAQRSPVGPSVVSSPVGPVSPSHAVAPGVGGTGPTPARAVQPALPAATVQRELAGASQAPVVTVAVSSALDVEQEEPGEVRALLGGRPPSLQRSTAAEPAPVPVPAPDKVSTKVAYSPPSFTDYRRPEGPALAAPVRLQRTAALVPPSTPGPFGRSASFASRFAVAAAPRASEAATATPPAEAASSGYPSLPLPVQRDVVVDELTVEPAPGPTPAGETTSGAASPTAPDPQTTTAPDLPDTAPAPSPSPASTGAGAAGASAADLEELAARLYEPLSARLRAELWLDRERAGI